jgi:hypothetical protein
LSLLSAEEAKQIRTLILDDIYKFGDVPHAVLGAQEAAVLEHVTSFDFSHFNQAITTILALNPDSDIFLFKETETATISSSLVELAVICVLIAPKGEKPPAIVSLKADSSASTDEFRPFDDLDLAWVSIAEISKSRADKELLDKFSKTHGNRVFALKNSTRKNPRVPMTDHQKALFMRVSLHCLFVFVYILNITHNIQFCRLVCWIAALPNFLPWKKMGSKFVSISPLTLTAWVNTSSAEHTPREAI